MEKFTRINNPSTLNSGSIATDLALGKEVILQFSQMPSSRLLSEINALCALNTNQLTVRFFSGEDFDCALVKQLPNVKSLAVDCTMRASNVNALTELLFLTKLDLGIYELKDTDILAADNFKNLTHLSMGATKAKAFNLAHLKNLTQLTQLFIEGHTKNIQAISTLSKLSDLRLHGISKTTLDFINPLKQLKTLQLTLGGRENLDEIEHNTIEHLIIGRVRGFNSLNNLKNFNTLKHLSISEQIQLKALMLNDCPSLLALSLHDCKTLSTLQGLAQLNALRYLRIFKTEIEFDTLVTNGFPKSLTHATFGSNKAIETKLLAMGYQVATWENLP
ncbi:MAG: hypothetical protein WBP13_04720 [Methylophilaceae bacterium]